MSEKDVPIHGTYPLDSGNWVVVVQRLRLDEVASVTGLEVTDEQVKAHGDGRDWKTCVYLWLNKGFIVIGDAAPKPTEPGLGMAMAEQLGGSPSVRGIPIGARAIYLHDGCYTLIERVR